MSEVEMLDLTRVVRAVEDPGKDLPAVTQAVVGALVASPDEYLPNRHVLGFMHCRIGEVDGRSVRLHIWPRTRRSAEPDWPVHTHHWLISSAVVAGFVENRVFNVVEDHGGPHAVYTVAYSGTGHSERHRTRRRVSMEELTLDRWVAGQRYEIPIGTFHSTTVPQGTYAATLVVTGRKTAALPEVVGTIDGLSSYRYRTEPVDRVSWIDALAALERSLARLGNG